MILFDENSCCNIYIEQMAKPGVFAVAKKLAKDIQRVSGKTPSIVSSYEKKQPALVIVATLGHSSLVEELCEAGVVRRADLEGKREVYLRQLLGEETLLICGSDKRGTIYGMFSLSEYIGISPLHFWGDAYIQQKEHLEIKSDINCLSKEPSIRYRGFFINDEWPCFGNWAFHHYGGFTAEMYDNVFELLLRLKGNYLWPAMWSSSFALDGPGEESAQLADLYGVIMGNSHHEPALRASEEWDIYKGEDTPYGSEWNYVTNKEGLLAYWKDGLARSGKYENIITVGMRGERDSSMQGPTSLAHNIEILKEIITEQKRLIHANYIKTGAPKAPLLLAIYKEVEQYYYGNDTVPGLKDWDGLSDVILMFCEDNFGHMRFLPEKEHAGGYGMYYHLDYHGEPISYEWINSTPLSAIWEQMTIAYEHGIKEVWMVNVGDLKGNEFPLSYFMDLAYDYETWGSSAVNHTSAYTRKWIAMQFGNALDEIQNARLADVLTKGVALIGRHRPESLRSDTYHPFHYGEADRVRVETEAVLTELEALKKELPGELMVTYESLIYDILKMGLNLILMQIYAGKNAHYATQGKTVANTYGKRLRECISTDRELVELAGSRQNGKWYGMYTGSHVGFRKWNEDGCRYPIRQVVEPFSSARMVVSRADGKEIYQKNYGRPDTIEIFDFMDAGVCQVVLEVANDGTGSFGYHVEWKECPWLSFALSNEEVQEQEYLYLNCNRDKLPKEESICELGISNGETMVLLRIHGKQIETEGVPAGTYYPRNHIVSILAEHFEENEKTMELLNVGELLRISDFGLCGSGVKAAPFYERYQAGECPGIRYRVMIMETGWHQVEFWLAPSNPVRQQERSNLALCIDDKKQEWQQLEVFPEDYRAGEADCGAWADAMLAQIRKVRKAVYLTKGVHAIEVGFLDGILVLEKLLVYPLGTEPENCCMGPEETWKKP